LSFSVFPARESEIATLVVKNLLREMCMGVRAARQRFPRVLELLGKYPDLCSEFESESQNIPSWMFLRWSSQMMATIGASEAI
jgi:DNA-dependent protein kinase catalytic subunit